jgi:hypothetical protein
MRRLIFAICLLLILPAPYEGASEVSIEIRDRMGFAPKFIRAQIVIEKNELNRELCVVGALGEMTPYKRCYDLDADRAPRRHMFEFKEVLAGKYEFYATVRRPLGTIKSATVPVHVLAPGESIGGPDDTQ